MAIGMIGSMEMIVILLIALLLFGGKKLSELAKSLGKGIREFKKASQGITEELDSESTEKKEWINNSKMVYFLFLKKIAYLWNLKI